MRGLALALVVISVVGCGDDGVPLDDLPEKFRSEYCRYLARCGVVPSQSVCEGLNIGLGLSVDPSLEAAIDAGKVKYDGNLVASCYEQLGSASCDRTDEKGRMFGGADCAGAIKGTVGGGGECALDAECKSRECDVPDCPDACCQGTCVGDEAPRLPRQLGESCESSNDCASGSYCSAAVCAALKPAGSMCIQTGECAYGLGCAGQPRVCKVLPTAGEPCPDGQCRDEGTYCAAPGMICAKVGLPGDACTTRADCSQFYSCDATMHCSEGAHEGQACNAMTRCADLGNFCDTTAMICKPPQPIGAACTSDTQCESNFCDGMAGMRTCQVEPICI